MINFLTPVLADKKAPDPQVSLWARLWQRSYQDPLADHSVPTRKILDVIERVRGAEAHLAQLQAERLCDKR